MKLKVTSGEFPEHTISTFARLLLSSDQADVTVVGEDLTRLPAHRLVLSAASPFLAALLQGEQGNHAVLYLGGLTTSMLRALLSFIYLGKVEVEERQVEQFTGILRDFQVLGQHLKGAADYKDTSPKPDPKLEVESDEADNVDDYEDTAEHEEDEQFKVEPGREALFAQIAAESPIKHTKEWIEKKIARTKALTCTKCQFLAKNFDRLESHIKRLHETEWPCDRCGMVLRTEGRLRKHIEKKHESPRSQGKCDHPGCDFETPFMGALNLHKKKEHGGEKYMCDQCPYSNWSNGAVKRHKIAKHEGIRFQCDQCSASYPFDQGLRRHKAVAHEGKRVPCPHCDYQATTNGNLNIHITSKHEGERFSCDICDWSSTQAGSLSVHKRQKHGLEFLV